ncbi:XF1762 family protein [Streptomyces sp. OZ13]|uniref:XF1762 family protein n=1 Tax=Streptomyces sp. OZ13 TaxID=3452210 RepID=UPI003F8AC8CE
MEIESTLSVRCYANARPRRAGFWLAVATRPGRCLTPRPPPRRPSTTARPLEVTRTATDGTRNANSLLYGAAWRAAKALGYTRLITYTQASETGASLRGTG